MRVGQHPALFAWTVSCCQLPLVIGWSRSAFLATWLSPRLGPFSVLSSGRRSPRYFSSTLSSSVTTLAAAMSKLESPASERNKEPIWQVIEAKVLPHLRALHSSAAAADTPTLRVVEIAAGAGIHTHYLGMKLAQAWPYLWYQATDPRPEALQSQQAFIQEEPLLQTCCPTPLPLTLDQNGVMETATAAALADRSAAVDLIININMLHVAPFPEVTQGLMKVAGQLLRPGGLLLCYGPYRVGGSCVESNEAFDAYLRERDPRHGLRDLETVMELARTEGGLEWLETVDMPANNLCVLYMARKGT